MAWRSWIPTFHLSKNVGKDILGGVKQALSLAQGPLGLVGIPALPVAIGAVLGMIIAVEVSPSTNVDLFQSCCLSECVGKQEASRRIGEKPPNSHHLCSDPNHRCNEIEFRA
jgi:hypothetical protein